MAKLFRQDIPHPVITKRHIIVGIIAILAVVGVISSVFFVSKTIIEQQNVAFRVDGRDYTKNEVISLIKYSTQRGGKKDESAKKAFEYLKRQAAAKKAGVKITDEQVTEARDALFPTAKTAYDRDGAPWIELASYNEALTRALQNNKVSDASGYVFIFPFDRFMQTTTDYAPKEYGNTTSIAKDRTYAQERARYYRDALASGTLLPDAVIKELQTDAKLGQLGMVGTNTSVRFVGFIQGDVTRPERYVGADAAKEVIALSAKNGIGEIKIGKSVKGEITPKSDSDYQEAYYYFVMIDKPAQLAADIKTNFETALKKLSASYKGLN